MTDDKLDKIEYWKAVIGVIFITLWGLWAGGFR